MVGKAYIPVVSMPCMELYNMQIKEYCHKILIKRIFIELGDGILANKYIHRLKREAYMYELIWSICSSKSIAERVLVYSR